MEKLFWYFVILTLTVLTAVDVSRSTLLYHSAPTRANLQLSTSSKETFLDDFELALTLPFAELDMLPIHNLFEVMENPEFNVDYVEDYTNYCLLLGDNKIEQVMKSSNEQAEKMTKMTQNSSSEHMHGNDWQEWLLALSENHTEDWDEFWLLFHDVSLDKQADELKRNYFEDNLRIIESSMASTASPSLLSEMVALEDINSSPTRLNSSNLVRIVDRVNSHLNFIIQSEQGVKLKGVTVDFSNNRVKLLMHVPIDTNSLNYTLKIHSPLLTRLLFRLQMAGRYLWNPAIQSVQDFDPSDKDFVLISKAASSCVNQLQNELFNVITKEIPNYYRKSASAHLRFASGITQQVNLLASNYITLLPAANFISRTDNCYMRTSLSCKDECVTERQLNNCKCVSWPFLNTSSIQNHPLCVVHCNTTEASFCTDKCDSLIAHSCNSALFDVKWRHSDNLYMRSMMSLAIEELEDFIGQSDDPSNPIQIDHPFCTLQLSMQQVIETHADNSFIVISNILLQERTHAKYVEIYAVSFGNLLSYIGNMTEFYLGLNVVCFLHMFIYVVSMCNDSMYKEDAIAVGLHGLRVRLDVLKSKPKKSKWQWIHSNEWFETTPLNTLGFIQNARHIWQIHFWYTVLLVFIGITVYNIRLVLLTYLEKPTTISTILSHNTTINSALPNFTFTLNVSVSENVWYDATGWGAKLVTVADLCEDYRNHFLLHSDVNNAFATDYALQQHMQTWILLYMQLLDNPWVGLQNLMLDEWYSLNISNDGDWENTFTQMSLATNLTIQTDFTQIFHRIKILDGYVDRTKTPGFFLFWSKIQIALVILKASLSGESVEILAAAKSLYPFYLAEKTVINIQNETAADTLMRSGVNLDQLHQFVSIYLRSQIQPSTGQVFLTDWDREGNDYGDQYQYQVVLPPGTDKVQLNIYSRSLSTHMILASQILNRAIDIWHFFHQSDCNQFDVFCGTKDCPYGGGELGKITVIQRVKDLMLKPLLDLQKEYTELKIEIDDRSILLKPFHAHHVTMQLSAQFDSIKDSCDDGQMTDDCGDVCSLKQHLILCACVPWPLRYLNSDQPLCTQPCNAVGIKDLQECVRTCKENIQTSTCSSGHYSLHSTSKPIRLYRWNIHTGEPELYAHKPLFMILIDKPKLQAHVRFTEFYALEPGQVIAQIGGHLELWLGINMTAFIHLLVFLVRECCCHRNERAVL